MKTKTCPLCKKNYDLMYRVRIDSTKNWCFLCLDCTKDNKLKNAYYICGGTWKG
jgi:hypothetical protein